MSKRDFFLLVLKIFGLYLLFSFLMNFIRDLTIYIPFFRNSSETTNLPWVYYLVFFVYSTIYLLLIYCLIFKPSKIISYLKLSDGFDDDDINFSLISEVGIIKISCIIIGALSLMKYLPSLLTQALTVFKMVESSGLLDDNSERNLIILFIKVIAGFLLLTNYRPISEFLIRKKED